MKYSDDVDLTDDDKQHLGDLVTIMIAGSQIHHRHPFVNHYVAKRLQGFQPVLLGMKWVFKLKWVFKHEYLQMFTGN